MLTVVVPLLGAVVLTLICGVFVLAEFSLITVDRATVRRRAEEGSDAAKGVLGALTTLSTQLSGTQVGITVTTLAVGFLAEPALSRVVEDLLRPAGFDGSGARALASTVALVVSTGAAAVVGELIPKNIAIARPLGSALAVQRFQRGFTRLAGPVINGCNALANAVLRLFGVAPQEELASARSPDELASLVRRSARVGTLAPQTAAMIERTLSFGERVAEEVMTPRTRVRALGPEATASAVVASTRASGLSRFPVLSDDRDEVVGVVGLKRVVAVPPDQRDTVRVADLMDPPVVIPGSLRLDSLLDLLRASSDQFAVVVDEFGGWDGIVTLEDLVEELVGDVFDEHDRVRSDVLKTPDGSWSVSGLLRPDEVAERTGLTLPEDTAYETVAGLVIRDLGRLATTGDQVTVMARIPPPADGDELAGPTSVPVLLTVLSLDRRRVDRLRLERIPEPADEQASP